MYHICDAMLNFLIQIKKTSSKKNPMSTAPMSRLTERAYLRLCPEKGRKKEFMHLKVI